MPWEWLAKRVIESVSMANVNDIVVWKCHNEILDLDNGYSVIQKGRKKDGKMLSHSSHIPEALQSRL